MPKKVNWKSLYFKSTVISRKKCIAYYMSQVSTQQLALGWYTVNSG